MNRAIVLVVSLTCASACGETTSDRLCPTSSGSTVPGIGELTCATTASPDASFRDVFDVDTDFPGSVGANYGQASCQDQYLVEVDLTQTLTGKNLLVVG